MSTETRAKYCLFWESANCADKNARNSMHRIQEFKLCRQKSLKWTAQKSRMQNVQTEKLEMDCTEFKNSNCADKKT